MITMNNSVDNNSIKKYSKRIFKENIFDLILCFLPLTVCVFVSLILISYLMEKYGVSYDAGMIKIISFFILMALMPLNIGINKSIINIIDSGKFRITDTLSMYRIKNAIIIIAECLILYFLNFYLPYCFLVYIFMFSFVDIIIAKFKNDEFEKCNPFKLSNDFLYLKRFEYIKFMCSYWYWIIILILAFSINMIFGLVVFTFFMLKMRVAKICFYKWK